MIYTRDEAGLIVEKFEDILSQYDIRIPSPEDDEREEDNMVGLYGSVYSALLGSIEEQIHLIASRAKAGEQFVEGVWSGSF